MKHYLKEKGSVKITVSLVSSARKKVNMESIFLSRYTEVRQLNKTVDLGNHHNVSGSVWP